VPARDQRDRLFVVHRHPRFDPAAASRIHVNDKNKIMRALEVRLLEGSPMSVLFSRGRDPLTGFRPIKLGLNPPRKLLYQRLDVRSAHIFEKGLIAEVRNILSCGVAHDAKSLESLGYKQALQVVEGRLTPELALESTQLETRRYAKRQITWFRKEQGVHWLDGFGDDPELQARALAIVHDQESKS
jgi:tRNA dimethylallyltransferase